MERRKPTLLIVARGQKLTAIAEWADGSAKHIQAKNKSQLHVKVNFTNQNRKSTIMRIIRSNTAATVFSNKVGEKEARKENGKGQRKPLKVPLRNQKMLIKIQ